MGETKSPFEAIRLRLASGPPVKMPAFDLRQPLAVTRIAWDPGFSAMPRIEAIDLSEFYAPVDLASERVEAVSARFNGWLESRLEEAFAAGHDFIARRVETMDDRRQISAETLSWVETFRWEGRAVPRGTNPGAGWTVYRRPDDWHPGWKP